MAGVACAVFSRRQRGCAGGGCTEPLLSGFVGKAWQAQCFLDAREAEQEVGSLSGPVGKAWQAQCFLDTREAVLGVGPLSVTVGKAWQAQCFLDTREAVQEVGS